MTIEQLIIGCIEYARPPQLFDGYDDNLRVLVGPLVGECLASMILPSPAMAIIRPFAAVRDGDIALVCFTKDNESDWMLKQVRRAAGSNWMIRTDGVPPLRITSTLEVVGRLVAVVPTSPQSEVGRAMLARSAQVAAMVPRADALEQLRNLAAPALEDLAKPPTFKTLYSGTPGRSAWQLLDTALPCQIMRPGYMRALSILAANFSEHSDRERLHAEVHAVLPELLWCRADAGARADEIRSQGGDDFRDALSLPMRSAAA